MKEEREQVLRWSLFFMRVIFRQKHQNFTGNSVLIIKIVIRHCILKKSVLY